MTTSFDFSSVLLEAKSSKIGEEFSVSEKLTFSFEGDQSRNHDLTSKNVDLLVFLQTLFCKAAKLSPNVDHSEIWNSGTVKHLNKPNTFTVKYGLSSKA